MGEEAWAFAHAFFLDGPMDEEVTAVAVAERVRSLVAPLIAASDVELVDVEHTGPALRVVVDRPGGLDLDAITALTREISRLLDVEDPLASRYTLEVSTPGLERSLRTPEHFVRAVGSTVNVKTKPDVAGQRRFTGLLQSADEHGIVVRLDPAASDMVVAEGAAEGAEATGDDARHLTYDEVERARTVFQWGPGPKPGKGSKPGAARANKAANTAKKKSKRQATTS